MKVVINAARLEHNARQLRTLIGPGVGLYAVVKADAYGHGASIVADVLVDRAAESLGKPLVDRLVVATPDEAESLGARRVPITVLQPIEHVLLDDPCRLDHCARNGWTMSVTTPAGVRLLADAARRVRRPVAVQVMLDTGLSRCGVDLDRADALFDQILSHPRELVLESVGSHFACADRVHDGYAIEQLHRYQCVMSRDWPAGVRPTRHLANSAATMWLPESHLDAIRVGVAFYGFNPIAPHPLPIDLKPALKLVAPLCQVRPIRAGTPVGYGGRWTAQRDTRIGIAPIGYADGYARGFTGKSAVMIAGRAAPVVGTISMDQTIIDLSDHPQARVGDDVTFIDDDPASPASAANLAKVLDTIPYEIVTRLGTRVPKVVEFDVPVRATRTRSGMIEASVFPVATNSIKAATRV